MQNLEQAFGGNFALAAAGLAIKAGGASPQFKTVNSVPTVIDGKFKTALAATAAISFSAGHATLNAGLTKGKQCVFAVCHDGAGNVSTVQGQIVNSSDVSGNSSGVQFGGIKKGLAVIGYIEVSTNDATAFIPGTTNLDAAGVTVTYQDCMGMPANPLTA